MKKIGFIDYYLDEWHANNYPEMFRKYAGSCEVVCAYGKIDSPLPGGINTREWGEKYGIAIVDSIEEVIERSDCLVVLSPDNPEMHEELSRLPLASGKRTYIDKTFAETYDSAVRLFDMAKEGNTPCYSASALYFAQEYAESYQKDVEYVDSCGPNDFAGYSIHQLEPITAMLKAEPVRVMSVGTADFPVVIVEYAGGKKAKIAMFRNGEAFSMNVGCRNGEAFCIKAESYYWEPFIRALAHFFETGEIPVPHENTLRVIAAREAAVKALERPFDWVRVKGGKQDEL